MSPTAPCHWREAHSTQFGRHLVAAHALEQPGAVVLEQPFAAVLYDAQVPLRCDWCFKAAGGAPVVVLQRCTRSKFAHFCCREHQRAAWRAYYRQECAALVACAPRVPPATVRLAARVLWRQQQQAASEPAATPADRLQQQLCGGTWSDVQALLSHWQELDDAGKLRFAQMAALTREFMLAGQPPPEQQPQTSSAATAAASDQEAADATTTTSSSGSSSSAAPSCGSEELGVRQIALLLARFACNNHTICDDELRPIGVGIYPLGALVNHACRPNCAQTFAGRNIVFRSLEPIAAGQQLTISYIEVAATRQERRRQLQEQYFFDIDEQHQQPQPSAAGAGGGAGVADGAVLQQPRSCSAELGMQDSGWHKLQLLVQLPAADAPAGLHQQELPLWTRTPCLEAVHEGGSSSSSSTSSSSSSSKPPWPEDAPDPQLCQMVLLLQPPAIPGTTGISDSMRKQQKLVQLPGGMSLLPPQALAAGQQDTSTTTAAAALSGLFKDLEGLGSAAEDKAAAAAAAASAAAAGRLAGGAGTQQTKDASAEQEPMKFEAVQWGDWGACLQQVAQQHQRPVPTAKEVAIAGAAVLLLVRFLQHQAAHLVGAGNPAAAIKVCQLALTAADGQMQRPRTSIQQQQAAPVSGAAAGDAVALPPPCGVRVVLGPRHVLRMRVLETLLCAAVAAAEWQLALQAAQQLVPLFELVYPKVWPNLGLHYAMLAKLQMLLEQPAAAAHAAEAAAAILRITHGGSAAVLQDVCQTRYEAGLELQALQHQQRLTG